MSKRFKESLSASEFKSKLNRMGISLDRTYHPLNYYKQMYFEKSNAKNKVTRNNTPFYREIINKKRQRSSSKKIKQKKYFDYDDITEEQNEEEINDIINTEDIKTTRLIESKKKKRLMKNDEKMIPKENNIILRNNNDKLSNKIKAKNEYKNKSYNIINNPGSSIDENVIKFTSKNGISNNKKELLEKSPEKNYILDINENIINENTQKKPKIINKKKIPLKRQNAIINNEEEEDDAYNAVEDNDNILIYEDNSNEINNDNKNIVKENIEEKKIKPETSSFFSYTQSRFSDFSNYSLMSLTRMGDNIISMKNCLMNKFRRNVYLFPLVILILFGILLFLNEKYENFGRSSIIIIFSIIMGLIILFHLMKYFKLLHNYKKIAKDDKNELIELFKSLNINKKEMGIRTILINNFIEERIKKNDISEDTYMKYVFPYLVKYLEKEGFYLEKQKKEKNKSDEGDNDFWKKL